MDLKGLRILNTRPQKQAKDLSTLIRANHGVAIEYPTCCIEPLNTDWAFHLPQFSTVRIAIFVSANAAHFFFEGLQKHQITWPSTIQVLAIGQATAQALQSYGISGAELPPIADSEHLLLHPVLQNIPQTSILLIKGEGGRTQITTQLKKRAAQLYEIKVYRRCLPEINFKFTHALWQNDGIDVILFMSQTAIENLFLLFEPAALSWIQSKPCVVISPRLATIANRYKMKTIILATYNDLLTPLMRMIDG